MAILLVLLSNISRLVIEIFWFATPSLTTDLIGKIAAKSENLKIERTTKSGRAEETLPAATEEVVQQASTGMGPTAKYVLIGLGIALAIGVAYATYLYLQPAGSAVQTPTPAQTTSAAVEPIGIPPPPADPAPVLDTALQQTSAPIGIPPPPAETLLSTLVNPGSQPQFAIDTMPPVQLAKYSIAYDKLANYLASWARTHHGFVPSYGDAVRNAQLPISNGREVKYLVEFCIRKGDVAEQTLMLDWLRRISQQQEAFTEYLALLAQHITNF